MATPASQAELNKFVKVVDEFKANFARLISPAIRSDVYATKDSVLIRDYETAVTRGALLNSTIENLVGAWTTFKRGYAQLTGSTSTVIGDAVDEIRSWFGYDPAPGIGGVTRHGLAGLGFLGAIQIPAAVAIAGVVSAALLLNSAMSKIFISIEASRIQRENPAISRDVALQQAQSGLPSLLPTSLSLPMLAAGALALYLILGNRK